MDEFEIGQIYAGVDGKQYVYKGGDPELKASWEEARPEPTSLRERWAENRRGRMSLSDTLRMIAQGATLGFADEIVGTAGGDAEASRERVAGIRAEHPVGSFLSEGVGGAWLPGGAGATAGRAVAARTGSRLLGGMAGGAMGGAAGGAVTGAGEAEGGLAERARGAALGGAVGGAAGAVLGGAGAAGGRAAGVGRGTEVGRHALQSELERAGVDFDPLDVLARLQALGPGSVPADLGENLGRQARASINEAPILAAPGGVKDRIRQRAAGTGERLVDEIRGASGISKTYEQSLREARQELEGVREEFYRPLERTYTEVQHPAVADALVDPRIREILSETPQGRQVIEGERPPSFLDLQRAMFRLRDRAENAGMNREFQLAREAQEAERVLTTAMREAMPEFAPAQDSFMRAFNRVAAHKDGRKAWNRPVSDITDELAALPTDEARDAFRTGILDQYEQRLLQRRGGGSTANHIIDAGPAMQEKLRVLVGSDEGFQRLLQASEREGRFRNTWRAIQGNSTTAQQLADRSNIFSQIPTDKQGVFRTLMMWIQAPERERQAAAELIGTALLSEGEDAARLLARDLSLKFSAAGGFGAAVGAEGGQLGVQRSEPQQDGGLFR